MLNSPSTISYDTTKSIPLHVPPDGRVRLNTERLKSLRRNHGFSQAHLAKHAQSARVPLSIATIKRAELGEPVIYRTALQLAHLFKVDVQTLIAPFANTDAVFEDLAQELPLVGRNAEVQLIKLALDNALDTRSARMIYIRGVAGMGKSRLFNYTRTLASQMGFEVKACHVPSPILKEDSSILLPILTHSILTGDLSLVDPSSVDESLGQLNISEPLKVALLSLLGMPMMEDEKQLLTSMSPDARKELQRKAIFELIARSAKEGLLGIFVEDLHWADDSAIDTLSAIIFETRELPVIWCVTSRYEHDPLETKIRPYLTDFPINILDISSLGQADADKLAQRALPNNPQRQQACIQQAQGNPLFLTQLLKSDDEKKLPPTLIDLVRFKLKTLSPLDQHAIGMAAALQATFHLETLQALIDVPDYLPTALVRQCLLRHCLNNHFAFVHDLIMRGIYEQLSEPNRQQLNERIASHYADIDVQRYAIHLTKAKHSSAPNALLHAVKTCVEDYSFAQALVLLDIYAGIDFAPINAYQLNFQLGLVYSALGNSKAAYQHYQNAIEQDEHLEQKLLVVVELARNLNVLDRLDEEKELLERYIPMAVASGNDTALGPLLYLLGNLYFPKGDYKRSRELHTASRAVAIRSNDHRTQALALSGLGDSYYAQGWMHQGTQVFRDCLELCEQKGLTDIEASNRFMLATTRLYLNETCEALQDALRSAEIANKVGNGRAEIVARLTGGWLFSSMGDTSKAMAQYNTALETARTIGASRFTPFLLEGVAKCHHISGNHDQAIQTIRQAWSLVEELKIQRFIGPWVMGTRVVIENDDTLRAELVKNGLQIIETGCLAHNHYRFYVSAAEAAVKSRNSAQASVMADRLENFTASQPCPWADHHIRLIRQHVHLLLKPFEKHTELLSPLIEEGHTAGLSYVAPYLHGIKTD